MATPALHHIAKCHPSARITVVGRPMLRPLMDGLEFVHSFEGCTMRSLAAFEELRRIRTGAHEACLLFPNSFRSALFARFTGASVRAGSHRDGRAMLLTHATQLSRSVMSAVSAYCQLAEAWTGVAVTDRTTRLVVTHDQRSAAIALLARAGAPCDSTKLILINPGANRQDKRWPAERFAQAAIQIAQASKGRSGTACPIAVTGGPAESQLCAGVAQACGGIDLCAAGISLGSLKGVIEKSALLLTNDTGPRHIAAALGTPTLSIFGPTDPRWTPMNYPCDRILAAEPFMTDDRIADHYAKLCAIERVAVGDVVHAGLALLSARCAPTNQ